MQIPTGKGTLIFDFPELDAGHFFRPDPTRGSTRPVSIPDHASYTGTPSFSKETAAAAPACSVSSLSARKLEQKGGQVEMRSARGRHRYHALYRSTGLPTTMQHGLRLNESDVSNACRPPFTHTRNLGIDLTTVIFSCVADCGELLLMVGWARDVC